MADDEAFANERELQESLRLLMRHWNSIGRKLEEGDVFTPLLIEMKKEPFTATTGHVDSCVALASIMQPGKEYSLVLRSPASHIEPIGGSDSTVPQARILYRALLVAKIRIDQPIALGITLRPLEVVEKCPGMEGANPSSIGDHTS